MYAAAFKRCMDVALSLGTLILISPILLLVALAVWMEDRGPAFFRQQRVGRDGKLFTLAKFRSMPIGTPNLPSTSGAKLRVTRTGAFIRRANLDELPQLLNILKGDMSVVGPRPALSAQEDLCRMRQENGAMACRPGLTGLAQVSSYDGMPEAEKARFDGAYAARITFLGDLKIILRTFSYLAHRPPVY